MTCVRCSRDLEDGSSFCRFCGAALGNTGQPRLFRVPDRGSIGGVCAGIADYLEADVTLVRLAWVILSIVPGLFVGGLIAYVVGWLLLPVARADEVRGYTGRRLVRSATDRPLAGVCGGVAAYLGVDATIVRLICVVLAVYPGMVVGGALAYAIAWLIIPAPHATPLRSVTTTV
jgi:phage shock protein PspC (stress-responsive transcriptional regulator)